MPDKKFYGLFGYPLGHSISPEIHARLFKLLGEKADYRLFSLPPSEFDGNEALLRSLAGFNVTIPYKRRILQFLDEVSARAKRCGAVNTVKNDGGRLCGYNTDSEGFLRALSGAGISLCGRVLLCGAGGAARMMACEVLERGCSLVIAARDLKKAEAAKNDLSAIFKGADICAHTFADLSGSFDLILNATPVGMFPKTDECPLPESVIKNAKAVFDAVYNPCETVLVKTAKKYGASAIGGLSMLILQAAAAQEIWTGGRFEQKSIDSIYKDMEKLIASRYGTQKTQKRKNIFLCGFMGCGKSTVGPELASLTGMKFVDMDAYIENLAGESVSEIFEKHGEARFRKLEHLASQNLSSQGGYVVATGGGAVLNDKNVAAMKDGGIIALIDVPLEIIRKRLSGDGTRPLLSVPDKDGAMRSLYQKRMPLYHSVCDICITNSDDRPGALIAKELAEMSQIKGI